MQHSGTALIKKSTRCTGQQKISSHGTQIFSGFRRVKIRVHKTRKVERQNLEILFKKGGAYIIAHKFDHVFDGMNLLNMKVY